MAKAFTPSFFDLVDACAKPGCPVCRVVERSVRRYLNYFFYESVNDIPIRGVLRLSRGYCPADSALLMQTGIANPLGISIVYHDVMTNVLRDLPDEPQGEGGGTAGWAKRLSRGMSDRVRKAVEALKPRALCPACEQRKTMTELVVGMLVSAVPEGKILPQLTASEGLCLPHLSAVFEHKQGSEALEPLLAIHREKWKVLDTELAEFIRKNDWRFKHEVIGSERDAWRRVLGIASGALSGPPDE